ncbi:hypothetical protein OH76DRAFT_1408592 [Lentinus brumalis]|uniref:F-box domain-containing protein n=1 Tax=Lentinus brumalis TaxID=2498619 RepID=A0A371CXG6_9APHY|nr:hypothetical protein OH76DRAFT_1408592 [Polyporus brumalis]
MAQPSASDSVLHNVDIVEVIIRALCSDEDPEEIRITCARAARVCHSFAYVALPVVWRRLSNLVPLWTVLLPDNVPPLETPMRLVTWEHYEQRTEMIKNVSRAKLYHEAPRWKRFLRYASYVHQLDCGCYSEGEIELLRSVLAHNKGRTILPALRCLTWHEDEKSGTTLASLSSTSLVELRLQYAYNDIGPPHDIESVVALLPSCFPSLQTFVFTQPARTASDDSRAFVNSLAGFRNLRALRIDSMVRTLDETLLRQLFMSMRLEELYFWIGDFEDLTGEKMIEAPYLRSLECRGAAVDMIIFLLTVDAPALATFKFMNHLFDATPTHMMLLCKSLGLSSNLRSLSLAMQASFEEPPELEMVDLVGDILHPVLSMSHLERLSFVYPTGPAAVPIEVQDEDIALIARSLPNLKLLEILYDSPDGDDDEDGDAMPPPLSAMSLVYIAQHCPRLEELHLQIVDTDLEDLTVPASAPTPSHPLRVLAIRDPDFEDQAGNMDDFLQLLDRLFPNLRAAGLPHVVPKSLQPDELSYLDEFGRGWKRSAAAGPRNVFVCS